MGTWGGEGAITALPPPGLWLGARRGRVRVSFGTGSEVTGSEALRSSWGSRACVVEWHGVRGNEH